MAPHTRVGGDDSRMSIRAAALTALIAAVVGAGAGVGAAFLVDPSRGPEGARGPSGPAGPEGIRGPRGIAGPASEFTLDWDEVWQAIEDDPGRLGAMIEADDLEVDPLAQNLCDELLISSISELNDIYYGAC